MRQCFALAVVFVSLRAFAGDGDVPEPTACNDEYADCKESCTIDYWASVKTRDKLSGCAKKCEKRSQDCRERFFDLHRNQLEPDAIDAKPRPHDPVEAAQPSVDADKPKEPVRDDDDATPKRTATRISDLTTAEDSGPKSIDKETAAAPAPPPKKEASPPPAQTEKKTSSAEKEKPAEKDKKKRSLEDWDPDAL